MTALDQIKILWWRLRYVFIMWKACQYNCSWSFAWQCAVSDDDAFIHDEMTPAEAVESEMSYWCE